MTEDQEGPCWAIILSSEMCQDRDHQRQEKEEGISSVPSEEAEWMGWRQQRTFKTTHFELLPWKMVQIRDVAKKQLESGTGCQLLKGRCYYGLERHQIHPGSVDVYRT